MVVVMAERWAVVKVPLLVVWWVVARVDLGDYLTNQGMGGMMSKDIFVEAMNKIGKTQISKTLQGSGEKYKYSRI